MISQRSLGIPYVVERFGCYGLVLGKMVEEATGVTFDLSDALAVLLQAIYEEYLDSQLWVRKPDHLLRLYLKRADATNWQDLYQVGADGRYWGWVKNKRVDYTALKFRTKHGNNHFLLGNESGARFWNPDPRVKLAELESVIYYQCKNRRD